MSEPMWTDHLDTVLPELIRLASERARRESSVKATRQTRSQDAAKAYEESSRRRTDRFESERTKLERKYARAKKDISACFERDHRKTKAEYEKQRQSVTAAFTEEQDNLKKEAQDAHWTAGTIYEAAKNGAKANIEEVEHRLKMGTHKIHGLREQLDELLVAWNLAGKLDAKITPENPDDEYDEAAIDPLAEYDACIASAQEHLDQFERLKTMRFVKGGRLPLLATAFWVVTSIPVALLTHPFLGPVINLPIVGAIAMVISFWLARKARVEVHSLYEPLVQQLANTECWRRRSVRAANKAYEQHRDEARVRRDAEQAQVQEDFRVRMTEVKGRYDEDLVRVENEFPGRLAEITQRRERDLQDANEKYPRLLQENLQGYESEQLTARQQYEDLQKSIEQEHDTGWQDLSEDWHGGMNRVLSQVATIQRESGRTFLDWTDAAWDEWTPPVSAPPAVRFGELAIDRTRIPGGVPKDERLAVEGPEQFSLPAVLRFPSRCSLLLKASGEGREVAEQTLQVVMLRFLTLLPPGKVRFTIIDPIGLGQNFSAFMHLADYDEKLVGSRIWTETTHIEQRLADLTEHMENVIQKYLRKQYESIEEYNVQAGEVAEPYRVLVIANFPASFTELATRRLISIAATGAQCGVYTLISVDTKQPLPHGFDLADLTVSSNVLTWKKKRFVYPEGEAANWPLTLDAAPDVEFFTRIIRSVGAAAKAASRVEVPFDFVAPPREQWWTNDSRNGLDVPFGRAGATKRQELSLGRGTAHHVLISGKTGSGKSTLLHALITNLALLYSPDEVVLYLVDFKKGVEFKTYANRELPHACVIAIESEREFGLSVIQRLDAELKIRGDLFRKHNVHDVNSYRSTVEGAVLPRILFIVDEFQEFFVEDDKVAQEAALLLDRLVRQGRAFGIHVLFGSQTLGGAYSLARSTIGQMAVRIALQCSEGDAHLILSEENSAARLLSRPGEAIYNDANGLVEGNHPFQTVWLSDERRDECLEGIRKLAAQRGYVPRHRQVIFEGNMPAELARNRLLGELLDADDWPPSMPAPLVWLGEAVAIKDPTAVVFKNQHGCNLLMIGQHAEAALSIMNTALVSLAAQCAPADGHVSNGDGRAARFYLLDGTAPDHPHARMLGNLAQSLPHQARVATIGETADVLAEVAGDVERRQAGDGAAGQPAVFLLIYDLPRFRDLRKQEDDYGFSRTDEDAPPKPAALFTTILRDGPAVGVHVLAWCDSLNNVNRWFDRQTLREFESRVLFQMSATDSSNLIDTPLASKLGMHCAFYCNEDQGVLEKFRPYSLPDRDWLRRFETSLRERQSAQPTTAPASQTDAP